MALASTFPPPTLAVAILLNPPGQAGGKKLVILLNHPGDCLGGCPVTGSGITWDGFWEQGGATACFH